MSKLKSIAAAAAFCIAGLSASAANAWTLINWSGSPGNPIYGAPWTPAINTIANSPIRWGTGSEGVWYTVYFEGRTDGFANGLPGLASSLYFRLDDVSDDGKIWTFDYGVWNASNAVGSNQVLASRVSSFSFDVNPDETGATLLPGGFFSTIARDVSMNAGSTVGVQDICVKTGQANNCNGGGGTGVLLGQAGMGQFQLSYLNAPSQLVFTDPAVRYQSLDYRLANGTIVRGASGTGIPIAWVPEPSTWAMMILGFGAAGAMLRRRKTVAFA